MTATVVFTLVLVAPLPTVRAAPKVGPGASMHRLIRLTLRDGSSQLARLDGVGCNESLCSRVAVNTRTLGTAVVSHTPLEDVATIRDIEGGAAVFVFKDGSTRHVSIVPDNRVLYLIGADGRTQKIGFDRLTSIDLDIAR